MPWSTQLGTEEFAQIAKIFQQLSSATRDRFELDRMLMNLFAIVRKPFADLPLENAPNWLRFACSEMSRPVNLAEGIPAFVRLAGRSPEHTSRELRKQGKCTPTEFINRLRLDHAARLLCTTELSVLETALECGFENQSHFHRCFRTRFRTTPLKYRQKNRAPVS
jgi:AraC family cel operon transcriptional repressor